MTFSEAVTEVLRAEAARTSQNAVATALAIDHMTVWRRITGRTGRGSTRAPARVDLNDAVVATYGLAPIIALLDLGSVWGTCIDCNERPKAMRGLLRRCKSCIRARKVAA